MPVEKRVLKCNFPAIEAIGEESLPRRRLKMKKGVVYEANLMISEEIVILEPSFSMILYCIPSVFI